MRVCKRAAGKLGNQALTRCSMKTVKPLMERWMLNSSNGNWSLEQDPFQQSNWFWCIQWDQEMSRDLPVIGHTWYFGTLWDRVLINSLSFFAVLMCMLGILLVDWVKFAGLQKVTGKPRHLLHFFLFSFLWFVVVINTLNTGSCVPKASSVECRSISLIGTPLTSISILYLVDTRLTLDRHLNWHSINSLLIVGWVSINTWWHVCEN